MIVCMTNGQSVIATDELKTNEKDLNSNLIDRLVRYNDVIAGCRFTVSITSY